MHCGCYLKTNLYLASDQNSNPDFDKDWNTDPKFDYGSGHAK